MFRRNINTTAGCYLVVGCHDIEWDCARVIYYSRDSAGDETLRDGEMTRAAFAFRDSLERVVLDGGIPPGLLRVGIGCR